MGPLYYLNGSFVREEEAKIPVSDLGVVRGYGVFDYLRTYQGIPFHLDDHLARLKYSAHQIGLDLPLSLEEIGKVVITLLKENNYPESNVKIVLTGGVSADQIMPEEKSTIMVLVYPLKPAAHHFYSEGIRTISTELSRPLPFVKTTHYIPAIMALQKARLMGAHDALYLNEKREVLEATTSNFFGFKNGVLITPASDQILYGITREIILKISPFPIEIRFIPYTELDSLDEAFICSSSKEIMPLSKIDHITLKLGPHTKEIVRCFKGYTERSQWEPLEIQRHTI